MDESTVEMRRYIENSRLRIKEIYERLIDRVKPHLTRRVVVHFCDAADFAPVPLTFTLSFHIPMDTDPDNSGVDVCAYINSSKVTRDGYDLAPGTELTAWACVDVESGPRLGLYHPPIIIVGDDGRWMKELCVVVEEMCTFLDAQDASIIHGINNYEHLISTAGN